VCTDRGQWPSPPQPQVNAMRGGLLDRGFEVPGDRPAYVHMSGCTLHALPLSVHSACMQHQVIWYHPQWRSAARLDDVQRFHPYFPHLIGLGNVLNRCVTCSLVGTAGCPPRGSMTRACRSMANGSTRSGDGIRHCQTSMPLAASGAHYMTWCGVRLPCIHCGEGRCALLWSQPAGVAQRCL
jgi:hypothetical protein